MPNVDDQEVEKFSKLKDQWWNKNGALKTLHDINPTRLAYILQYCPSLKGKKVLDVGCGGGILTEALANEGANVTAIDLAPEAINVAKEHATQQGLDINYQMIALEDLGSDTQFELITCLEMLEHVPDPGAFIHALSKHLAPNGRLILSTINRTAKAYLHTIVAAEYLLKIIPKQTHDYKKYIKPSELSRMVRNQDLQVINMTGLGYNPLTRKAFLQDKVDVNYLMVCKL